jgi:hypothetical protein
MTIDERLEAISHTLEIVSQMQLDNEVRLKRLEDLSEENERRWKRLTRAFEAGLREYFREDGDQ